MARKYQHTQEMLPQIKDMIASGMTQKEVENALGLTGDRPIHNLLKRERKKRKYNEYVNKRKKASKDFAGIQKRKQATENGK